MADNAVSITLYKAKIIGLLNEALALMDTELRLVSDDTTLICGPEHRAIAYEIWRVRHNTLMDLIDGLDACEGTGESGHEGVGVC